MIQIYLKYIPEEKKIKGESQSFWNQRVRRNDSTMSEPLLHDENQRWNQKQKAVSKAVQVESVFYVLGQRENTDCKKKVLEQAQEEIASIHTEQRAEKP